MSQRRRKKRRGIRQWREKLIICRRLLSAVSEKDLAEKIYIPSKAKASPELRRELSGRYANDITRVADRIRKWHKSTPIGETEFLERLARALGCPEHLGALDIIESSLEQFIEFLPEERQPIARAAVGEDTEYNIPKPREISFDDYLRADPVTRRANIGSILVPHINRYEPVRVGIRKGQIDTAHYYLDPDAADGWYDLVRADAYPTYDQCKAGLRALVAHDAWLAAVRPVRPRTAVMLAGGGAPTKDLVILQNLIDHRPSDDARVTMFLVDVSPFMLLNSWQWIHESRYVVPELEYVDWFLVNDNVLNLRECREVFRGEGPIVFAMTGGTIGNLRERSFFEALERVAAPGDLFILSADTIDESDPQALDKIRKKYDHPQMRNFLAPVIDKVARELGLNEAPAVVSERIDVRIDREATGVSDVPGAWSLRVVLEARNRDITLVSSTRYNADQLASFAATFGWELLCAVPSPMNAHYVQLCFRKVSANVSVPSLASKVRSADVAPV